MWSRSMKIAFFLFLIFGVVAPSISGWYLTSSYCTSGASTTILGSSTEITVQNVLTADNFRNYTNLCQMAYVFVMIGIVEVITIVIVGLSLIIGIGCSQGGCEFFAIAALASGGGI